MECMRITNQQWELLEPFFPEKKQRKDKKGRPGYSNRALLDGVLWVLKTGARWSDLPKSIYPSYPTCYRAFQRWVKSKLFEKVLRVLIEDLEKRGKIKLAETFIDATFVDAKKGVKKLERPSVARELKSWQSWTIGLFQSPCALKVLHRMRVSLLKKRFGASIQNTFLKNLSETRLTILIHSTHILDDDLESNLLLPISGIEKERLRMEDLYAATKDAGEWRDFLPGSSIFEE